MERDLTMGRQLLPHNTDEDAAITYHASSAVAIGHQDAGPV